jgi:general secretion pathway protein E
MTEIPDPLEAELSTLRPQEVSSELRCRIAERLAGVQPAKRRRPGWLALAGLGTANGAISQMEGVDSPKYEGSPLIHAAPLLGPEAASMAIGMDPQIAQARGDLQQKLKSLAGSNPERTSRLVDMILADALRQGASDVHIEPTHRAVEVHYRLDGVLHHCASLEHELAPNLIARLKVLAELLTYRIDIPQEGRLQQAREKYGVEMRLSTFPLIHGEKAVVRIFDASVQPLDLEQLGLVDELRTTLEALLQERTGAIFLTGPSGSGKTTTIYACLRHLLQVSGGGRHCVTIEDPVEQVIEGVSQAQARPGQEFNFARGLRSLLRQDPEVIMIGEVRDAETAKIAVEAALTGHLVLTTLHAGSACGVVGRLLEMGVEPYLITSGLKGILNQRLVRRICSACRGQAGSGVAGGRCEQCASTGYHGRILLAEFLALDASLRQAILVKADSLALEAAVDKPDRVSIRTAAAKLIAAGLTTAQEVDRVLGPGH